MITQTSLTSRKKQKESAAAGDVPQRLSGRFLTNLGSCAQLPNDDYDIATQLF
ncbi:MAG: hypothetical protein WCH46_10335 [bacterium]